MSYYYDKQGNPMELLEWATLFEDTKYKRIAETTLPDGKWISTVWLGLDHQYGIAPPLIFETMAFPAKDNSDEEDTERYSTLAEAEAGHRAMVAKYQKAKS